MSGTKVPVMPAMPARQALGDTVDAYRTMKWVRKLVDSTDSVPRERQVRVDQAPGSETSAHGGAA